MMLWLKMGGGGMGGDENGAGQSQQLWHSLAGEGALDDFSPASPGCESGRASFAVPGVRGKN